MQRVARPTGRSPSHPNRSILRLARIRADGPARRSPRRPMTTGQEAMSAAMSPGASTPMHQVQPVVANDRPGEHLYVTAGDGVLLQGRRWLPEQAEARAAVIFMHGIASHGAWFAETAAFLAEHEIAVCA